MQLKIGILDDEIIICETLKKYLTQLGYVCNYALSFDEAVAMNSDWQPDLFLLDINLNSTKSGIDFGQYVKTNFPDIPIIFISSYSDDESIKSASSIHPDAFLIKPFNQGSIHAAVEVAVANYLKRKKEKQLQASSRNYILIKQDQYFVKIMLSELLFIKSEGVYLQLYTMDKKFLVRETMQGFLDQLNGNFMQVHRSYIVNTEHLQQFSSEDMIIQNEVIPIGKSYREAVLSKLGL